MINTITNINISPLNKSEGKQNCMKHLNHVIIQNYLLDAVKSLFDVDTISEGEEEIFDVL